MMSYRVPNTGGFSAFSATIPGRVAMAAIVANVLFVFFFLNRLMEWADWSIGIWGLLFASIHLLAVPIVLLSGIFVLGNGRIGTALSITAVCTGITFIVLMFQEYSGDSEALRPLFILPVLVAVTVKLAIFEFQTERLIRAARATIGVPIVVSLFGFIVHVLEFDGNWLSFIVQLFVTIILVWPIFIVLELTGRWRYLLQAWPYLAGGYVVSAAYYIAIHGATFDFSPILLFRWLGGGCFYWAIGALSLGFTKKRSKGHAIALVICVLWILALLGNFLPDR
jgi:hypothetical protein